MERGRPGLDRRAMTRNSQERTTKRARSIALVGGALVGSLAGLAALVSPAHVPSGLTLTVLDSAGETLLSRDWPNANLEALSTRLPASSGPLRVRLEGLWYLPGDEAGELSLKTESDATWWLDGRPLLRKSRGSGGRHLRRSWELAAGWHPISLEFEPRERSTFGKLQWARSGERPQDLEEDALFRVQPDPRMLWRRKAARLLATGSWSAAALSFCALAGVAFVARRRQGCWPAWWVGAALPAVLVVGAGSLRFEAVVGKYWNVDAPEWARRTALKVAAIRPDLPRWAPARDPYRGDPWGYLLAAREPRGVYDAHVREPLFVLATKALLPLVDGHDVAVNLASAVFSVLTVLGTYALGCRAFSVSVGFWAAFLFAVERHVIELAVQGWRDDAFGFFVVLTAFGLVGLLVRPSPSRALLSGFASGLACLTRITSLSFAMPGLAWLLLPPLDRRRTRSVALAALVAAAIVAPYLIACQIAFGDALYSINYHTGFYRFREGMEGGSAMSWDAYLSSKGMALATLDTVLVGLTHYPFANKWRNFEWILPGAGQVLAAAAVLGLLLFARRAQGRLLLVVLVSALLPFAFTWPIPGGHEWRFTLHAYPFYLLAACLALETIFRALRDLRPASLQARVLTNWRRYAVITAAWILGGGLVWAGMAGLLYWKGAEAVRAGRTLTLAAGPRDWFFFGDGWGPVDGSAEHSVRRVRGDRALLYLPLESGQDYELTLRIGLAENSGDAPVAHVFLNGVPVDRLPLAFDPSRLGVHNVALPRTQVKPGRNRLEIRAAPVGTTLWWFRVSPRPRASDT